MDEQYGITLEEKERVLANYFKEEGTKRLEVFPSKEKKKIIILQHIAKNFLPQQSYTEKEVNAILKPIYHDHVSVRRYLIEYGFMERSNDCTSYWLKR
ncbi:hypothetical protein B0H99_103149 [Planomicrobium soli]|uniref:DUF2087 domain-containing protein n=1 Tax=Planomicrobium soli TaxID=1176648 RepID=A0A2P8H463_9BACL|nr:DUF2087 domain-containing protein [Planomicrobium soli]PSL41015.1 hypothetical protein B0H99_103149 [Planomicrobium soli]